MSNSPTLFTGSTMACDCPSTEESCIDVIVSLAVISSMFIVSEILPFLRSHEGNGLTDCLIKTFETSECCLSKMIEFLGKNKEDIAEGVEVVTKLNTRQEQEMTNKNSININIGDVKRTETEKL